MIIEMSARGEHQNIKVSVEVEEDCTRDDIVNVFITFLKGMTYHTADIEEELL